MDKNADKVIHQLQQQGILPLFFHESLEVSIAVMDALYSTGIRLVEYTNRGDSALGNFTRLVSMKDQQWPDLILGVGTIKSAEEARAFITAEAAFIVCPGMNPEVGKVVNEAGLLWIPGCMTATELMMAGLNGAKLVKLFPGSLLGPGYLKAMREIFPSLLFMPTGGVEIIEANMSAWFRAGASVLGLGSKLISAEALTTKHYTGIEERTKAAISIVKKLRNGS